MNIQKIKPVRFIETKMKEKYPSPIIYPQIFIKFHD